MQVRVKICGITNTDDALTAVNLGADALGFVFFQDSPRHVSCDDAAAIIRKLPPFVTTVGVFVNENPEQMEKIVSLTGIDIIQLHGDEPPSLCTLSRLIIKAIRVKSLESLDPLIDYQGKVSSFLLDTYTPDVLGGSGRIFNWEIASYAKRFGRIILAGGLTPDNVAEAVRQVKPYGVDVSSGVESRKCKKDHNKMKLFIERAKGIKTPT
jgi:phosphoribosylanthranilate isomerase